MVTYRTLQLADVDAVAAFAADGMPSRDAAGLRFSPGKVRSVVEHFAHTPSDFHLVAFDGGQVVGAIAACVTEMLFFERCEATVVMCQARGTPGVGRELIGRLMAWVTSDMRVRRVQFPMDVGARRGYRRLLSSAGFVDASHTFTFTKD